MTEVLAYLMLGGLTTAVFAWILHQREVAPLYKQIQSTQAINDRLALEVSRCRKVLKPAMVAAHSAKAWELEEEIQEILNGTAAEHGLVKAGRA